VRALKQPCLLIELMNKISDQSLMDRGLSRKIILEKAVEAVVGFNCFF